MFEKIYANCLLVDDFKKALGFYKDIFGLKLNSIDENGGFADFVLEGTSLAIFDKRKATAMLPEKFMNNGGGVIIAFQVNSLDEAVQTLSGHGLQPVEGPKTTDWGQYVVYYLDPDGNIIEISQA